MSRATDPSAGGTLPERVGAELDGIVQKLISKLGRNLYACLLYGSAVRGDMVAESDVNLLVVLEESTPAAHASIAEILRRGERFEPFIIGRHGMDRTIRAFATKFLSIRRNYRLLHGEDFLAKLHIDPQLDRFLVEQALRNQRLRLVHAFVTMRDEPKRFTRFLTELRTGVIVQMSEALRLAGIEMPHDYDERVPIIAREMNFDATVLSDLAEIKAARRVLSPDEIDRYHTRLFGLVDAAVRWIENRWPSP